jgi:hypothetical protein
LARFKNFKELAEAMKSMVDSGVQATEMRLIGEFVKKDVRTRTKLGYGVKNSGEPRQALKSLSEKYAVARKASKEGLVRFETRSGEQVEFRANIDPIDKSTTPKKSNLTFTGQMLDAIDIVNITGKSVTISVKDSNRHDKRAQRQPDKTPNNNLVAQYVTEAGRPFMNLSDLQMKRVSDFIRQGLDRAIKKFKK